MALYFTAHQSPRLGGWVKMAKRAARKAIQKAAKAAASTNPIAKAVYKGVEDVLKVKKTVQTKPKRSKKLSPPIAFSEIQVNKPIDLSMRGDMKNVTGTETITLVTGNTAYAVVSYQFNPIDPNWPNLASESAMYQRYRVKSLKLHWEPSVATTTTGMIQMGWLNDPTDEPPQSIIDSGTFPNLVSLPVWQNNVLNIKTPPVFLYIDGSDASDAEARQLYATRFFLAVFNVTGVTGNVGLLKLEYSLELTNRIPPLSLSTYDVNLNDRTQALLLSRPLSKTRRSWFRREPNGDLTLLARGRYAVQIYLHSSIDENVDIGAILPFTPEGVMVPGAYESWKTSSPGFAETNAGFSRLTFIASAGDRLTFSGLGVITGLISGSISVDRL